MKNMWKSCVLPFAFLLTLAGVAIGNEYYNHGGYPATGSAGSSAGLRAELDSITAGFDKLPSFTSNANKAVIVNSGATALTVTTGTLSLGGNLSLAGNFATTGAFNTSFTQGATTTLTLPLVNGTLATLAGTETFTTKTFDLASNTLTGTTAQFNTALSDNDFATLAGAESLSNKTIAAPVLSGIATGTYTLGGTPTITAPIFSGTATGTYTLGGTPTIVGHAVTGSLDISGASAGQIVFPASQNASAGLNTLDDYEEGSWTPSVGGTATYIVQTGRYTKIGRVVHVECHLQINAIGTGSQVNISGLPFASASGGFQAQGTVYYTGLALSIVDIVGYVSNSSSTITLASATTPSTSLSAGNNVMTSGTNLDISLTYHAS